MPAQESGYNLAMSKTTGSGESKRILENIRSKRSKYWESMREKNMLELFHAAATRVPAYADFLSKNSIKASSVASLEDFKQVPPMNKANYLRLYDLKDLCWDGDQKRSFVFAATSGSTGKPFYFPHGPDLVNEYSVLADLFLEQNASEGPTLVLITFGMGVWIGGVFTFQAFERASDRGKNISILTPGVNKPEILHALRELAPKFSQTIVIGYPPFVKDVLDDAQIEGVDLAPLNLRLMFAAESFTERFRDHVASIAHIDNVALNTLNIYGTADIGAMAWETPTAITLRRMASKNESYFSHLFGDTQKTPTLAQYNPLFTNFEAVDGEIFLTGNNAIPLIRYAVGDRGGVRSFAEAETLALSDGLDVRAMARDEKIPLYELPLVYVYERADFSTKLYGAIIYPEHIREALLDPALLEHITGKFAIQTLTDEKHDQYLEVNVELREHSRASDELSIQLGRAITTALLEKSSEYKNNHASMKDKVLPRIVLWPHEDPKYFKPNIKQKWVIKPVI